MPAKVLINGIVKNKEIEQLAEIINGKRIEELSETDNKIIKNETTNSVVDFFVVILINDSINAEIHEKIKNVIIGKSSCNFKGRRTYCVVIHDKSEDKKIVKRTFKKKITLLWLKKDVSEILSIPIPSINTEDEKNI